MGKFYNDTNDLLLYRSIYYEGYSEIFTYSFLTFIHDIDSFLYIIVCKIMTFDDL